MSSVDYVSCLLVAFGGICLRYGSRTAGGALTRVQPPRLSRSRSSCLLLPSSLGIGSLHQTGPCQERLEAGLVGWLVPNMQVFSARKGIRPRRARFRRVPDPLLGERRAGAPRSPPRIAPPNYALTPEGGYLLTIQKTTIPHSLHERATEVTWDLKKALSAKVDQFGTAPHQNESAH